MSNNKPYQYHYTKPMQVTMPESLYSVVYSETAFEGLDSHPAHFHTIEDAQAFIDSIVDHTIKLPTSLKCLSWPHHISHNNTT